ncbi:beta strand repeat-containing protein [Luteolibacter sp. AS25]|uniref:beta strand repeat-containing protein n=1 Tax=Luteolibacter sp. AS25 TaxID=3135776 RepID=UPI00398A76EA
MKYQFLLPLFLVSLPSVNAATFLVPSGNTSSEVTLQSSDVLTVDAGGTVSDGGGGQAVAISASSGTVTINNSGTIVQTGDGRGVRNNSSGTPNVIVNNQASGVFRTNDGDGLRADVSGSSWTVNNWGLIDSENESEGGAQAIDFDAVTSGTVIINNYTGGTISAYAADAIRPGANATIVNAGSIIATPDASGSSSDGIDTQFSSGVDVTNTGVISGRTGITGGENVSSYSLTVRNNAGGEIIGVNGSGINTDGQLNVNNRVTVINEEGATIRGGVLSTATEGDGDGVDVDGVINLTNSGDILAFGAKGGSDPEAIAAGGGTIINTATGRIIGSNKAYDGSVVDDSKDGHGILIDDSDVGNAVAPTTITNSGLIQGLSGYGIRLVGEHNDTFTNNAGGTIRGTDNTEVAAVIRTGSGNDIVNNAGTISHDLGNLSGAINTEGGNDTVNITGNAASITGSIDGGTGTDALNIDLGSSSDTFSHSGAIKGFESVNVISGKATFNSANSDYLGTTTIGGGTESARLEQNGSHTGGGDITVESNGTLAGTGTETLGSRSDTITVDLGGVIAPGAETETGRFTLGKGSAVINGTASFSLEGMMAGVINGYDQFLLGDGDLTLGADSVLDIDATITAANGTIFTLFDLADATASISGMFKSTADVVLIEGSEFAAGNGSLYQISYAGGSGNDLTLTAIPEPRTGLLLLGAGALAFFRRRKG